MGWRPLSCVVRRPLTTNGNFNLILYVQHKAYFLIQLNADSLYPYASLCLLIPILAFLAYPDADYPDADPD